MGFEEEDGGDRRPDLDQVGLGRLAVFDLEGLSFRFEYRGYFFRRHVADYGLSALKVVDNQLY